MIGFVRHQVGLQLVPQYDLHFHGGCIFEVDFNELLLTDTNLGCIWCHIWWCISMLAAFLEVDFNELL